MRSRLSASATAGPRAFPPDGKWVSTLLSGPPTELVLLPTGAGRPRNISLPGLNILHGWLLGDGRTVSVRAFEPGKPSALWTVPLEGAPPRLVLTEPAATGGATWLPDGKRLARHLGDGKGDIVSLDGGPLTPLRGLEAEDRITGCSADGRYLFVYRPRDTPGRVFRIEIETGKRELWKELMPADPVGVITATVSVAISRDEKSYAYQYLRAIASDLYVLEGMK